MEIKKDDVEKMIDPTGADFFTYFWEQSLTYIKTVVDVVREPVLILDSEFRIMAANESFYQTFQTQARDTENKIVYELGNGQWNIPALRELLEGILPRKSFFKGFQVAHEFPSIGRKVMILNGREIHIKEGVSSKIFPPIILLAIEDVTEMMVVAESLVGQVNQAETKFAERTRQLEININKLQEEISALKGKI
jgi:hypothetical protein